MRAYRVGLFICSVFLLVMSSGVANAESKAVFGVKPGTLIQSSYFGIDGKRWQPFAGLDLVAFSINEDSYDAAAAVWIPHLGAKMYFRDAWQTGKVAPYIQGDYFFSIASVSVDAYESEEEDLVSDLLEFWGVGLAFGMEYYFSENFGIGGEYGIRFLQNNVKEHSRTINYGGGYSYEDRINDEFSVAFRMNYAAISANFHF